MRKLIIIVLLLLAGASLWGFRFRADKAEQTEETRLIKDASGREISIPARPQRVIALNSSNIDLYYGAGGSVIAKPDKVTLRGDLAEKIRDLPTIGESGAPSVEKIISLKPDLVLGLNMAFHQRLVEPLEQAGIPVLLQSLGGYHDTLERLRFYGQLSGKSQQAEEAVSAMEEKLVSALEKKNGKDSPRVLLLFGTPDSYSIALPSSFSGSLLELLQGENVAEKQSAMSEKTPYMSFNMEFVVRAAPDMIFILIHGSEADNDGIRQLMEQNAVWRQLGAVKSGKVYILPYALFGINPGTRTGEAIEYMGNLLYGGGEVN